MKKHNEGYSLVLVLVVLVLMSLVASFILSVSLKNLQSQTAAVSRMEDKYTAAGEIEKIVAELEAMTDGTIVLTGEKLTDNTIKYSIVGSGETVQINCTLLLTAANIEPAGNNEYTITAPISVEYLSYEHLAREVTQDE